MEAKILDFKQIDPNSLHVAFETSDVVITLRDPWSIPIQLLKRTNPMLSC
jgi:hypothetical protein